MELDPPNQDDSFAPVRRIKADLKTKVAGSCWVSSLFRNLQAVAAVVCTPPSPAISSGQGHFTPGWSPATRAAGLLRLLAISENQISPVL